MSERPCRKDLLDHINAVSFAVDDVKLFLDTHPTNRAALTFYGDTLKRYLEAIEVYEDQFGPLTAEDSETQKGWTWVETPWPWEMED